MRKLAAAIASLFILGCANEMPRRAPLMVTMTVSAPRLLFMNEPPTAPVSLHSLSLDLSRQDSNDFSRFQIDVPICGSGTPRCVPAIGVVTLSPRIDHSMKGQGLLGVSIALTNDVTNEAGTASSKLTASQHVGTTKEKISYGVIEKTATFSLEPGAVSNLDLPHGIAISVLVPARR